MSEQLKAVIGDELYQQLLGAGVKANEVDLVKDWIPKARFNEIVAQKKAVESKVSTFEQQIKDTELLLKDSEEFKTKYNDLSIQHKTAIEEKDKELLNVSKNFLIESKLKDAGVKHPNLLTSQINIDDISVEGNNLLGFDKQLETLKTNYSDLFVETKTKPNDKTNTKPDDIDPNIGGSDDAGDDWGTLLDGL